MSGKILVVCLLFAVVFAVASSESHLSKISKKHNEKKHHLSEGGETWKRLHRSNKHGKERLHHLGHDKEISKHIKNVQKHAPLSVSHHDARLQSDLKAGKQNRHHPDWHRQDLHLQDLTHPHNNQGHHGHNHEKPSNKHQLPKKATSSHEKNLDKFKLHEGHTKSHLRSGHQIHKPVVHHESHNSKEHSIRLHTNSRARAALRLANQHKRADREKPKKFKKAFEKKKYGKTSPHYLW